MSRQTKTCTKCGKVKALRLFGKKKDRKDGYQYYCKACISDMGKLYYCNNKESFISRNIIYFQKHGEKIRIRQKEGYYRNIEKRRLEAKIKCKNDRKLLKDVYIRQLLTQDTSLKAENISPELVAAKREHIKLGRILKGMKNGRKRNGKRCKRKAG